MMRERCACERLVSTISTSMKAEVMTSLPQAARENASRIASVMMPSAIALRNDLPSSSETTLCSDEQRRQDQERAEHVRILEGAAGAVIQRQQVAPAGDQVEIAGDRRRVAAISAPTIEAAPQHVEPRRGVLGDHHREEDHRDRHVPGGRDPVRDLGLVDHRDGADACSRD